MANAWREPDLVQAANAYGGYVRPAAYGSPPPSRPHKEESVEASATGGLRAPLASVESASTALQQPLGLERERGNGNVTGTSLFNDLRQLDGGCYLDDGDG